MEPRDSRIGDVIGTEAFLGGPRRVLRPEEELRPEPEPGTSPAAWRRWWLPAALFAATCLSTWHVGASWSRSGWAYAAGIMTILAFHELGHFLQARRYRVPASPPYFIPMPFESTPIGTMGAIIAMRSRITDTKALFDIAITGPLAGLVPTFVFGVVGLKMSSVGGFVTDPAWIGGKPILFRALERLIVGPALPTLEIAYHPFAVAAWTGFFITALNLIPIGQLDGGHILYSLVRKRAHTISRGLVLLVAVAILTNLDRYWPWIPMLLLILLFGIRHPPTAKTGPPLGRFRVVLGWLTLSFILVGFTPSPFPV